MKTLSIAKMTLTKRNHNWSLLSDKEILEIYNDLNTIEIRECACGCHKTFSCKKKSSRNYFDKFCCAKVGGQKAKEVLTGVPKTVDHRKHMSEGGRGKVITETHRQNLIKGGKAFWASLSKEEQLSRKDKRYNVPNRNELNKQATILGQSPEATKKRKKSLLDYYQNLSQEEFDARISKVLNNSRKGYLKGDYYSKKNNYDIKYQSSYELKAYIKLEKDQNVLSYKKCDFSIPYSFKNKIHGYFPDILIDYVDHTRALIEVKPEALLTNDKVVAKREALKEYCKINNLKELMWTEENLGVL